MIRVILPGARKLAQANVGVSSTPLCAYHAHPPAHPPTTMNELPVPQGSWQSDYDAKQRKYNMHLLGGIGFMAGTFVVAKASGLFDFNASVPKLSDA